MNSHKNARLTFEGHKLLIKRIATMGLMPAADASGISLRTGGNWRKRFETFGAQGLMNRTSSPLRTRTTITAELAQRIELLRRKRMPMCHIAQLVGRSVATVCCLLSAVCCLLSAVCCLPASVNLSSLKSLDPKEAVLRCEHEGPGDLLHMDMKKLGRINASGHRIRAIPAITSVGQAGR